MPFIVYYSAFLGLLRAPKYYSFLISNNESDDEGEALSQCLHWEPE